jgi:hypothetical protein
MDGCCEHGNELSVCVKGMGFLDQLNGPRLLKEDFGFYNRWVFLINFTKMYEINFP